jgi:magnesium-transporting ATPase (P-type)
LLSTRQRAGTLETNIPFGPIRKRQLVAVRPTDTSDYVRVVVKGAPEYVLPMCDKQLTRDGDEDSLTQQESNRILEQEVIENQAKLGLRTLAYAYKDIDINEWEELKASNNEFESEADRATLE